jgi:hypothetical protein
MPRGILDFESRFRRETKLIAPQDSNCTTEGRELDFSKAGADAAEETMRIFGCGVADTMRIRLKKCFRAIVHIAEIRLSIEIKRIGAGEAHLDHTLAALHCIKAGPEEVAIIEYVSGRGHDVDVVQSRLGDRGIAADGRKFKFSRTKCADERSAGAANNDVARDFFQMNISGDAFKLHVAHHLLDVDQTRLRFDLQLGFFRNDEREIFLKFCGGGIGVQNCCGDIDAIIRLFCFDADSVGKLGARNDNFLTFGGLYFNTAIGDILDGNNRAAFHREMFFEFLAGGKCRYRQAKYACTKHGKYRAMPFRLGVQDGEHFNLRSFRDRALRTAIPLSVDRQQRDIHAPTRRWGLPSSDGGNLQ